MINWDYCCCAIPVLNVGAYFTLSEQFVLGILVGTLSFATPSLVGAAIPFTFGKFILSAFGYVFAGLQIMGFLGVFKEKAGLFRRYVSLNWIVLYAGMSVAATFIGISAARHTAALNACKANFFHDDTPSDDKADQICNIFTWVILGIMGGLWLVIFIAQSYLVLVLRNYGVTQRADHTKYHSVYSTHDGDNMMLNNVRSGATTGDDEAWNTRPSTDSWHPRGEGSYRDNEAPPVPAKISPDEKAVDVGYGVGVMGTDAASSIGPSKPSKQQSVDNVYLEHPSKAVKSDKAPTTHGASYYDPPDAPPSYHGHDPLGNTGGATGSHTAYQPYDPYMPPKKI